MSSRGVKEKTLPSPEEYLKQNPIPGGLLYYPGSFVDAGPMKLFHQFGGLRRFIHVDYRPHTSQGTYQRTTEGVFDASPETTPIGPEKFRARRWKDLWHSQVGERWEEEAERSFGFKQEFRFGGPKKHVDFTFMSVDAIGAWKFLIRAGSLPDVVVMCADGLNWTEGGFGGEGRFYQEVKKAGHWPEFLFVGCSIPWPGYEQVSHSIVIGDGLPRSIYRREKKADRPTLAPADLPPPKQGCCSAVVGKVADATAFLGMWDDEAWMELAGISGG